MSAQELLQVVGRVTASPAAAMSAVLEGHHDEPVKWYEDPKKQIDGALALGSLAFILGFIGTVLGGVALTKIKRMSGGKYSNNIV